MPSSCDSDHSFVAGSSQPLSLFSLVTGPREKASSPPSVSRGFTIIELMVVVAVFGILVAIGAPRFQGLIQSTRTTAQANELATALNYARSEATRRGLPVSFCSVNANWEAGWEVRVGDDTCAGELLRVWEAPPPRIRVINAAAAITFGGLGQRLAGDGPFLLGFTGCAGVNARSIVVGPSGRIGLNRADCASLT